MAKSLLEKKKEIEEESNRLNKLMNAWLEYEEMTDKNFEKRMKKQEEEKQQEFEELFKESEKLDKIVSTILIILSIVCLGYTLFWVFLLFL